MTRYGAHVPTPLTVTVRVGRREEERPASDAIHRQRQQINDLAAGLAAKAVGQARATDAHPDDRARVDAAIRTLAATGRPFSANDARAIHGVKGGVVGAAFGAARRSGLIVPVGDETSSDPGTHAHRIFRWTGQQPDVGAAAAPERRAS